jgi:hypothetical protein
MAHEEVIDKQKLLDRGLEIYLPQTATQLAG